MSALNPHPFVPRYDPDALERDRFGNPIDDGPALPDGVSVDLRQAPMDVMDGMVHIVQVGDGFDVDLGEDGDEGFSGAAPQREQKHDSNLAEFMTEGDLSNIAAQVIDWVEADMKGRAVWFDRLAEGLELLGVVPQKEAPGAFKLTKKVTHPLIMEAAVQFQARAVAEFLPPGGPAKALVLGESSEELEEQAERVADYQNYQLMVEDRDYYTETDRLLFVLSYEGSQFKKVYKDPLLNRPVSRWVRGEDFIVPYGATTLASAPRYTHQIPVSRNDMKKLQQQGTYRKIALATPTEGPVKSDRLQEARDQSQGQENAAKDLLDELPHTAFECHCDWDLKGFEHKDPDGVATGIGLPYVITVDRESCSVLAIRRNWKENDETYQKRMSFVHFPYLPGDGFYSYGLIHAIGGLGYAASGLLRIIMLGAAFASMQGGFKSVDAKISSNIELEFGKWIDTEMTAEELSKAFYTPQFREPSEALFKVLGLLVEGGQRFSSTTESMVGDASNTGPVGTTVALIEQGSKVFSGIHSRLHYAQGEELKLLAELNGEHLPEEGYPYAVHGKSRDIMRSDFDDRVDVLPVSDPNIFSSTQRIAIAQTLVQRSTEAPDLYDRRKVEKRFLTALRVADPDDVLIDKAKMQRCDPVTENAFLIVGKGARAYQDQAHDAHIAVHMDQLHRMEAEQNPLLQRVAPIMLAHVAEHMAYGMRVKMAMAMGVQLPPMNLDAEGDEDVTLALPPQIENALALRAAAAIAQLPPPQTQQADAQAQALQKQAEALQKEAQALAKQREALQGQMQQAERERAAADFAKRELALREQLAQVKQASAGREMTGEMRRIVDEAVSRVEAALAAKMESKEKA